MELSLFLLTFALFWKCSTSVRCYQCVPELSYIPGELKCDHFDGSDRFMVDCTESSMCYKKVTALYLNNGITPKSYYRGCAAQTLNGEQKKVNGKWQNVHDIHDVYDEDCKADDRDPDHITTTVHCYCRGELCNRSRKLVTYTNILFTNVVILCSYNLMYDAF